MKKYLSIFAMMAVMFAASSLVISCSGDDDEKGKSWTEKGVSKLVGTWDVISNYSINNYGVRDQGWFNGGNKWVFTENTLTIYSSNVRFNQPSVGYKFINISMSPSKEDTTYYGQIISGELKRDVIKLTKNRMEISQRTSNGYKYTKLVKEGSDIQSEAQYRKECLIGTWKIVSDISINESGKSTQNNDGNKPSIWIFTDMAVTMYDNYDLLYGGTQQYTYDYKAERISISSLHNKTIYDIDVNSQTLKLVCTYSEPIPCTGNAHRESDFKYQRTIIFKKIEDIPRWTDTMDVTVDATRSWQSIDLRKLDTKMNIYGNNSWAFLENNWSNPILYLTVLENTSTSSRTCDITVEGTIGNKVIIHITQQGKAETPNP